MAEMFGIGEKAEYPRQLELPAWGPATKMTESERRADFSRRSSAFRKDTLDEGMGVHPLLFWDERRGFFRFSDGTFALSRSCQLASPQRSRLLLRAGDVRRGPGAGSPKKASSPKPSARIPRNGSGSGNPAQAGGRPGSRSLALP